MGRGLGVNATSATWRRAKLNASLISGAEATVVTQVTERHSHPFHERCLFLSSNDMMWSGHVSRSSCRLQFRKILNNVQGPNFISWKVPAILREQNRNSTQFPLQ